VIYTALIHKEALAISGTSLYFLSIILFFQAIRTGFITIDAASRRTDI
jgi:hypothetical protein